MVPRINNIVMVRLPMPKKTGLLPSLTIRRMYKKQKGEDKDSAGLKVEWEKY